MTPEERFAIAVQHAFVQYRNEVDAEDTNDPQSSSQGNYRRLRNVRECVGRLVGQVSEVNWLSINYMERW